MISLESTVVPTGGETLVLSGFTGRNRTNCTEENLGVPTLKRPFVERYGLIIERTLVDSKNAMIYSRIYNPREENVKIYRHTHITLFTPNDNVWQVFELRTSKSNKEQIEVNESLITDIPEHLRDVFTKGYKHLDKT